MTEIHLSDLVDPARLAQPDATAFIQNAKSVSRRDFALLVDRSVIWLQAHGVAPGDAVALWLVNSVEWIALFAAIARIGAIAVPVNTRYRSEEVVHILAASRATILMTHGSHQRLDTMPILAAIAPSAVPLLRHVVLVNEPQPPQAFTCPWPVRAFTPALNAPLAAPDSSDAEQPAVVFSTSGTTKAPKLVMHPQRTLVDHAQRCATALGLVQPGAVLLAMLPMCGVFGLNSVLAALAGGAPIVIQDVFDAQEAAHLMRAHQVTHTFGSDEMFRRLAECANGPRPFPAARFFGFGAFTSSFGEFAQQCVERGMPLHGLYGSSEVLALFAAQPAGLPLEERLMGGGQPIAGREASVRVRDTSTGELLADGASGELEIGAPTNFTGYLHDAEATANAFRDGHFKTGDLGFLRPDGTFVFESRLGDAMRLGGHLVNPSEIEEIVKRQPGVQDAHVVAAQIKGQPRAVAFVIAQPGSEVDAQDIVRQLRHAIAGFKVPARIWMVDAFPQMPGANGLKTSRVQLRQMAAQRIAEESADQNGNAP